MPSDSTQMPPVESAATNGEAVHTGPPPGLLRLVKVLGAVMVLLFVVLIGGIIWKATHRAPPPPVAEVVVDLGLDPAAIRHMTMEGGQLAIATDKELVVIDIRTRKAVLRSFKP